jgi:hypothetical protein
MTPPPRKPTDDKPRKRETVSSPEESAKGGSSTKGSEPAAKPLPTTTIRNVTSATLSFRVPGQSASLGPGEARQIPQPYLETAELKALLKQGSIVVEHTRG